MPAKSKSQANYMKMALAVKHGHDIEDVSNATKQQLRMTAKSMTDTQLRDFSHVATRPKKKGS